MSRASGCTWMRVEKLNLIYFGRDRGYRMINGRRLSSCIYIYIHFKTVVPFRRPHYRTSHCYSELSGDYWDKLSHSTITDIFAGIYAQAQTSGKGIR